MKLLILCLKKQLPRFKANDGFTLIELLVVVIILGVLAAVSVPNIFANIGRGREAEAQLILNSLARGQQAYFFEHAKFADSFEKLEITFQSRYYNFLAPNLPNSSMVVHRAESINPQGNNTRQFELGIYYQNFTYINKLCQSLTPGGAVAVPTDPNATVCSQGKMLR